VPYRPTERTESRKAATRTRIVGAARELIAHGGYAEAQVAAVADRAGVATGTVYRHFPSKADLFSEVFREASQHEVDALAAAAGATAGGAPERIAAAAETFAERALRAPRLAWALLAEPVDPAIEAERLVFRRAYRDAIVDVIEEGIDAGELPPQESELVAAALVGAIGEAMVGPLSPTSGPHEPETVISSLRDFCIRSVTGKEPALVNA
jgi:AcrR family transcriptional regulator